MATLIAGLVLFLGVHSIGFVAGDWRARQVARIGEGPWKALYALASLAGVAIIIWGFVDARAVPIVVWHPPRWAAHLTAIFATLGFILIAAAFIPGTRAKASLGHPMIAGVESWAFGHLAGNGTLAGVMLFGAILGWTIWAFAKMRQRDRETGRRYPAGSLSRDLATAFVGVVAAMAFALFLHGPLTGVTPFG